MCLKYLSRKLQGYDKYISRQVVSLICLILLDFGSRQSRPNQGNSSFPDADAEIGPAIHNAMLAVGNSELNFSGQL